MSDTQTYAVRVVPVRVRWHLLWELHIEGGGVTQSKRRRGDAERTVRDWVHLTYGTPYEEVDVVLVAGCPTPCDSDCDALCHEAHAVRWKRDHDPASCERREPPGSS